LSQPAEFGVLCIPKPYFGDDDRVNLRANSLQQGEDDVPMEGSESIQSQGQSNSKEVQEAIQAVREFIEDQGYYPAVPVNACSKLMTLIT